MAGGLLARQLRRALPELSVALVEARLRPRRGVGESTVELGSHYLNRRLGLSSLLYREHLPKQGLRFYFDAEGRDLPMDRLSEVGMPSFAFHPSFQVDRARLDASLLAANAADGVQIWRGWRVRGVALGRPHEVRVERGGRAQTLRARWVIDASGRRRLLGRQLGLTRPAPEHTVSAAWCRVEGFGEIEASGGDAWRARWHYSSRDLATNHFCQDRSWIWAIPLRGGLTSLGWVGMPGDRTRAMATRGGLLDALRQTAALRPLLEGARAVDLGTGHALAYGASRFVSEQRWALVGEAAAFTDPFYSPGADLIAWHNDAVTELVRRDVAGEPLLPHAARIDALLRHRWRLSLGVYVGQYDNYASYDLWRLRYVYDVFNYFNAFSAYLRGDHLDPGRIEHDLAHAAVAERCHAEIGRLFAGVAAQLRREGRLFEGNRDGWDEGLFDWNLQRGLARRTPARALRLQKRLYTGTRGVLRRALSDGWRRPPPSGWIRGLFDQMRLGVDFSPG